MESNEPATGQHGSALEISEGDAVPSIQDELLGIPPQLRRGFWKACSRVIDAAVEIPSEWLEGKARITRAKSDAAVNDIRAKSQARATVIFESSKLASESMAGEGLASRAIAYHFRELTELQENRERVVEQTIKNLPKEALAPENEIDTDWLNFFWKNSSGKSTDDFAMLFGKILAGEITRPGSFSLSTIQCISSIDQKVATLFSKACSISSRFSNIVQLTLAGYPVPGANGLAPFGIKYVDFQELCNSGLVNPDVSHFAYPDQLSDAVPLLPFEFGNETIYIRKKEGYTGDIPKFIGPFFTRAGLELRSVVPISTDLEFLRTFALWSDQNGLEFLKLNYSDGSNAKFIPVKIT